MNLEIIRLTRDLEHRLHVVETQDSVPILARYKTSAGQSIPNATDTVINFDTLAYDTWSLVTTGASWKFTAALAGYYLVTTMIEFDLSTAWAVGERVSLRLAKGGTVAMLLAATENHGASNHRVSLSGCGIIHMLVDEYIDIRVNQASGAARTLIASDTNNHVAIVRVG